MPPKMPDEQFDKLLKEALPIIHAMDAPPSPPPPDVLHRLEADRLRLVEELKPQASTVEPTPNPVIEFFEWLMTPRRLVPVAITCCALLVVGLFIFKPGITVPTIQLAMLDTVGATRGTTSSLAAVLQGGTTKTEVKTFSASAELKQWLGAWPADGQQPVVKIIYNVDDGILLVAGRVKAKPPFEKTFPVQQVQDLPAVLKTAQAFIAEQTR